MASEVAEITSIRDEDLLRRMWQQSEDFGRKKEIRAHMYKLREERLRDFYTGDMDAGIVLSKSPLTPSHGESLADQSFQSFKTKEIRDSESPTRDLKYSVPNASEWNIVTSTELTPDGKTQKTSSLATTSAVQDIPGGQTSFSGRNEQLKTVTYDGDNKNMTSSSGHTSNTVVIENTVGGDENNGRVESTTNTTSSSKTVTSQYRTSNGEYHNEVIKDFDEMLNSAKLSAQNSPSDNTTTLNNEPSKRHLYDESNQNYFNANESSEIVTNQNCVKELRRNSTSSTTSSVDTRKIQQETEYLASLPGQLISRTVDYPDPHTKVITETKTLSDGSTVTTTKYETRAASSKSWTTSSKKKHSSASHVVTEDRAQRNRVEYILGDNTTVLENEIISNEKLDLNDPKQNSRSVSNKTQHERINTNFVQKDVSNTVQEDSGYNKEHEDTILLKSNLTSKYEGQDHHKIVKKDLSNENVYNTDEKHFQTEQKIEPLKRHTTTDQKFDNEFIHSTDSKTIQTKICIDHIPTHEAFAKSLRSVSPPVNKDNGRSFRSSTSSVRKNSAERELLSSSFSETSRISSRTITKDRTDSAKKPSTDSDGSISPRRKSKDVLSKLTTDDSVNSSETIVDKTNNTKSTSPERQPKKNSTEYDATPQMYQSESFRDNEKSVDIPGYERPTESYQRHIGEQVQYKSSSEFQSKTSKKNVDQKEERFSHRQTNNQRRQLSPSNTTENILSSRKSLRKQKAQQSEYDLDADFERTNSSFVTNLESKDKKIEQASKMFTEQNKLSTTIDNKIEKSEDSHDGAMLSVPYETQTDKLPENDNKSGTSFCLNNDAAQSSSSAKYIEKNIRPLFNRSETYEERCASMLGMRIPSTEKEEDISERENSTKSDKYVAFEVIERDTVDFQRPENIIDVFSKENDRDSIKMKNSYEFQNNKDTYCLDRSDKNKINEQKKELKTKSETQTETYVKNEISSSDRKDNLFIQNSKFIDQPTNKKNDLSPIRQGKDMSNVEEFIIEKGKNVSNDIIREDIKTKQSTIDRNEKIGNTNVLPQLVTTSKETSPEKSKDQANKPREVKKNIDFNKLKDRHTDKNTKLTEDFITSEKTCDISSNVTKRKLSSDLTGPKSISATRSVLKQKPIDSKNASEQFTSEIKISQKSEPLFDVKEVTIKKTQSNKDDKQFEPNARKYSCDAKNMVRKKTIETEESKKSSVTTLRASSKPIKENKDITKTMNEVNKSSNEDRKHITSAKIILSSQNNTDKLKSKSLDVETNKTRKNIDNKIKNNVRKPLDYSVDQDIESDNETIETNSYKSKMTRKFPITERKDSAPVYRSTKVDKDLKISRSTSDAVLKTTSNRQYSTMRKRSKPEIDTSNSSLKRTDSKHRPTKCVTTKTINLTTTNTLNNENMENIIIDIQLAKSSREPTPNRIIPTPVSPEEDTGKPRYPDTVLEPDDVPKRKSAINNIPKFEQNSKECCHISEVFDENINVTQSSSDFEVESENEEMVPTIVDANKQNKIKTTSLVDQAIFEDINESQRMDDSLLSVQDKVLKFVSAEETSKRTPTTNKKEVENKAFIVNKKVAHFMSTAEQTKKTRASTPFKPEKSNINDNIENDQCLLSVTDKVTKFLKTAENSIKPKSSSDEPAKRTSQKSLEDIDETLQTDDCLLSVSDKVNKFISTAEKLTATFPQKSPLLVANIERQVSRKQNKLEEKLVAGTDRGISRSTISDMYKSENQNNNIESQVLEKPDNNNKATSRKNSLQSADAQFKSKTKTSCNQVEASSVLSSPINEPRKKVTDRYVPNQTKDFSPPSNTILRSAEVIKKAKAVFESVDKTLPKQRDILSRPSIWEDRRSRDSNKDVKLTDIGVYKRITEPEEPHTFSRESTPKLSDTSKINLEITPVYMRDKVASNKDLFERRISATKLELDNGNFSRATPIRQLSQNSDSQEYSPTLVEVEEPIFIRKNSYITTDKTPEIREEVSTSDKPSYMNHTLASLEHIRRDSIELNKSHIRKTALDSESCSDTTFEGNPKSSVKFGVELKRTDSQLSHPRRKSSCSDIPHIEEIYELELLEKMLETVVGYEQRRRIRSQIRIVRKNQQNENTTFNKLMKNDGLNVTEKDYKLSRKLVEKPSTAKPIQQEKDKNTKSSPSRVSHTTHEIDYTTKSIHSVKSQEINRNSESINEKTHENLSNIRNRGPSQKPISKMKSEENDDNKPIWTTKNILKKGSESKTTRSAKPTDSTTKIQRQKTLKDVDDDCCVTSSYGIGPIDDDGQPVFGLRALKKKSQPITKVSGTIVRETAYSENGNTPVCSRTTTHYSSDPDNLKHFVKTNNSSLENTKKSLREITSESFNETIGDRYENIENSFLDTSTSTTTNKTKVVRRGSVKEITEKFIQNESNDKVKHASTSSYPKAGLILRSRGYSSRESTPGASSLRSGSEDFDECDIEVHCSSRTLIDSDDDIEHSTRSSENQSITRSFLNSNTKVSGVQDVLTRMRNADNVQQDGDSSDDREARALLNKFLGASVLMTGIESMVPKEMSKIVGRPTASQVKTTRVTKVEKSSAAPVSNLSTSQIYNNIEEIWNEELIKQLLDQSTNYEERRKLRARLRQVMAEKEVCDIGANSSGCEEVKQSLNIMDKTNKIDEKSIKKQESEESEEEEEEEDGDEEESEVEESEEENNVKNVEGAEKNANESDLVLKAKPPSTNINKHDDNGKAEQSSAPQGESFLLPLLQGLLHKKTTQPPTATNTKNANKKSDHNSITHIEDSGTESGEDLRLLAAGLHDHIEMNREQSQQKQNVINSNNLLSEVTSALNRLQTSLRDGKDIDLDINKRNALLTLVSRLKVGLISPEKILPPISDPVKSLNYTDLSSPEVDYLGQRRTSGHNRFAKRRNRQNRHTVGVSHEELADARRFIDELNMIENISNCATPDSCNVTPPEYSYNLQKQYSVGALLPKEPFVLFRPNQFMPNRDMCDSSMNSNAANNPPKECVVQMRDRKPNYKFMRQSLSFDQSTNSDSSHNRRPYSESISLISDNDLKSMNTVQNSVHKLELYRKRSDLNKPNGLSSEDDELRKNRSTTVKLNDVQTSLYEKTIMDKNIHNTVHHSNPNLNEKIGQNNLVSKNIAKLNRSRTPPGKTTDDASNHKQSMNKFNSRKLKMKRANTIDIPKTSNYLLNLSSDNEDENDENDFSNNNINYKQVENSVSGLRTTIQASVKVTPKKVVPKFKPKTENDHKFLAFIQKQNTNNGLSWKSPSKVQQSSGHTHNWSNAFGSIKNTFENPIPPFKKPPLANSFWKPDVDMGKPGSNKTLFSKPSASMHKTDSQEENNSQHIVNGSLKVQENVNVHNNLNKINKQSFEPRKIIVPKPVSINEFSHAPRSAFQPIPKKLQDNIIKPSFKPIQPETPRIANNNIVTNVNNGFEDMSKAAQDISSVNFTSKAATTVVNPFSVSIASPQQQIKSPTSILPWANKTKTNNSRVLNLASSKFDVKSPEKVPPKSNSFRSFTGSTANLQEFSSPISYKNGNISPIQLNSNSLRGHPIQSANGNHRLPQKRGSLPNETSYSYFNECDVPNFQQTQNNTQKNEMYCNTYNSSVPPQKYQSTQNLSRYVQESPPLQPPFNYGNDNGYRIYSQEQYKELPAIYQPPPSSYQLPPPSYQPPPPSYQPPPPPSYQPPPPPSYQQHANNFTTHNQRSGEIKSLNECSQNRKPKLLTKQESEDFPAYPYTCTDYTQPSISTYIPKVTITNDDSLTNPSGEPLVLSNTRTMYSPSQQRPELLKIFDYPSSSENSPQSSVSPIMYTSNNDTLEDLDDYMDDGGEIKEYGTVKSQVMKGPVSQTAVTITNKTSHIGDDDGDGYDGKGSKAAKSLHSFLKNIKNKSPSPNNDIINKYAEDVRNIAKKTNQQNPIVVQKILDNKAMYDKPVTGISKTQFKTPAIIETPSSPMDLKRNEHPSHVIFNNVSKYPQTPSNYSRCTKYEINDEPNFQIPTNTAMYQNETYHAPPPSAYGRTPVTLSKSDSWHQICQTNQKPPSPHNFSACGESSRQLQKTKSGHNLLTIPKKYEAGIKKTELIEKQKTVAAYFAGQSPQALSRSSSQQNINEVAAATPSTIQAISSLHYQTNLSNNRDASNKKRSQITRIKTSEKASISKQIPSSGLARSHTMPHIVNLNFLDETNVEDAFEDLFNETMS